MGRGWTCSARAAAICLVCVVLLTLAWKHGLFYRRGSYTAASARFTPDGDVAKACEAMAQRTSQRHILLTGAAGFIGFHAAQAFVKGGNFVVGVDNFNAYYPVSLKHARAAALASAGISVLPADLNDAAALAAIFNGCNISHVVHLAAQAGVRYAARAPHAYVDSNIRGSVTLLEAIRRAPQHRGRPPAFIYASSSSVYGLSESVPFSETDVVNRPASLYAATKAALELTSHVYHHIYGVTAIGLRLFTVYGPWGRPDMSYFMFARSLLRHQPIRVFRAPGGVELARDFTFVGDVVGGMEGALALADRSISGTADSHDSAGFSSEPSLRGAAVTAAPSGESNSDAHGSSSSGGGGGGDSSPGSTGASRGPVTKPGAPLYRIFNLGGSQPHTVTELVTTLSQHLGIAPTFNYTTLPALGEVVRTHANISAAAQALGYAPRTPLREGLRQFTEWYLGYYGPKGIDDPSTRAASDEVDFVPL